VITNKLADHFDLLSSLAALATTIIIVLTGHNINTSLFDPVGGEDPIPFQNLL